MNRRKEKLPQPKSMLILAVAGQSPHLGNVNTLTNVVQAKESLNLFVGGELELTRVLLVDGYPMTRRGHRSVLKEQEDLQVVADCSTGREALRYVVELRPSLVILGLNLQGGLDGILTCRKIKDLPEPPRVLVCAGHNEAGDFQSCYLAGADSFLHKRVSCEDFIAAILLTAAGERVWEPGEHIRDQRTRISIPSGSEPLTLRQQEVFALRLRGYSRGRIARELSISLNTVKFHLKCISRKRSSYKDLR